MTDRLAPPTCFVRQHPARAAARLESPQIGRHHQLHGRRHDIQLLQSWHVGADDVVLLQHQQLVAGQRLAGQQFHDARLQSRERHRHIDHPPLPAGLLQDVGEQFAELPDARSAQFIDRAGGVRPPQRGHHRIRDIADIDRLERVSPQITGMTGIIRAIAAKRLNSWSSGPNTSDGRRIVASAKASRSKVSPMPLVAA